MLQPAAAFAQREEEGVALEGEEPPEGCMAAHDPFLDELVARGKQGDAGSARALKRNTGLSL